VAKGHPAHKNPVVVPVSLSFVRAPAYPGYPHLGYPGLKGCKTVVAVVVIRLVSQARRMSNVVMRQWREHLSQRPLAGDVTHRLGYVSFRQLV